MKFCLAGAELFYVSWQTGHRHDKA